MQFAVSGDALSGGHKIKAENYERSKNEKKKKIEVEQKKKNTQNKRLNFFLLLPCT